METESGYVPDEARVSTPDQPVPEQTGPHKGEAKDVPPLTEEEKQGIDDAIEEDRSKIEMVRDRFREASEQMSASLDANNSDELLTVKRELAAVQELMEGLPRSNSDYLMEDIDNNLNRIITEMENRREELVKTAQAVEEVDEINDHVKTFLNEMVNSLTDNVETASKHFDSFC